MLIAERMLKLQQANGTTEIPVRIFLPQSGDRAWSCRFAIGWPDGEFGMDVFGEDSVQALELALKTVGAMIYASDQHASGNLMWLEVGSGYGFPVPNNMRDVLVGDDKKFF